MQTLLEIFANELINEPNILHMTPTDRRRFNKGTAQPGAGRPKGEPTKTIRVPIRLIPLIKQLCKTHACK